MADEQKSRVRLEIAHVLFIDIVGYSKLRINEQSAQIEKLREIVRGTEQFRAAEAEGKLLRLPTGDGGALAFPQQPGGTGTLRRRNCQSAKESSRDPCPHGHPQWSC